MDSGQWNTTMITYKAEMTDLYAGQPNYNWVKRYEVREESERKAIRKIKQELGITGTKCDRENWCDFIVLRPRTQLIIIFIELIYE